MQLGLTLPLRPAQTVTSLVANVAAFNGSLYAQDFSQDMRINWKGLVKGDIEDVDLVSELTSVPRAQIDKYACRLVVDKNGRKSLNVAGQVLSHRQFERGNLRVCPKCLLNDERKFGRFGPYTRVYWHVASIRTCADHDVPLIALPTAEFPRSIHDTFGRIRDHWALIEDAARRSDRRKASTFERYQIDRLEGLSSANWLSDLPFEIITKTAEMLGLVYTFGPKSAFSRATDNELAKAGAQGFDILLAGRDGIRSALKQVQNRSQNINAGHYTDFGNFARWLERMAYDARYEQIRDIYRKFVFQNYPISKGELVLGEPCPKRYLHSFATIKNEFDINPLRLKNFLWGYGFAKGKRTNALNTQEIGYFDAEFSEAKIRDVVGVIDRLEAAKRLNISRSTFDRLRKSGIISPVADFEGLKGLYQPDKLDDVLNRVLGHAEPVEKPVGSQMAFGLACNKAKLTMEEVLPRILDGGFTWLGRKEGVPGLGGLLVDLEEMLDLFEAEPLHGYTKQELKRLLRVNDPTVTYLVNRGFIEAEKTRHPRSRRPMSIVPEASYTAFLDRFVTLGILAHQIGTQAKHVSSKLEKLKIDPINLAPRFSKIYERRLLRGVIESGCWVTEALPSVRSS